MPTRKDSNIRFLNQANQGRKFRSVQILFFKHVSCAFNFQSYRQIKPSIFHWNYQTDAEKKVRNLKKFSCVVP